MTEEQARTLILEALGAIAPEIDPASVDASTAFGSDLGLDSMDFLNLVERVATIADRSIPERDYPEISTLAGFAAYLAAPSA